VKEGDPERYPVKAAKKARPQRIGTAFWLEREGHVLLCRRPPRGMLGGMRALPSGPWTASDPGLADAPAAADWRPLGRVSHIFTHFALDLAVVVASADSPDAEGEWWPVQRIEEAGLPTLFAKAAALAQSMRA
jgi:A/G-specific adenine glycosylase